MDGFLRTLVSTVVVALLVLPAQAGIHAFPIPESRIPDPGLAPQGLQPLGDAPFGERIDLHTGEVLFHQVDIVLEGTGPTIRIARTRPAHGDADTDPAAAFGDWRLDVPRLETLVASVPGGRAGTDWRLGAAVDTDSLARCSRFAAPHAGEAGIPRDTWWEGYVLQLGDGLGEALLKRAPAWTLRPGLPGDFPAVTASDVHVGCLPATRNGEPGEAFLAAAPDGTRYRLDWLVGEAANAVVQDARVQARMHVAMLATRVEDRFGNWVDYTYDGRQLQSIQASDGRAVEFEWTGDRVTRITTHPGSEAPRTWRYDYTGRVLTGVVLPDASRWSFDLRTTGGPGLAVPADACTFRMASNTPTGGGIVSTLTAPSGLTGTFVFEPRWQGRSGVPSTCETPGAPRESVPPMVSRLSLVQRTWTGPGVDARWDYRHGPAQGSATRDACTAAGTCADTQWIDVVAPDGARVRHAFATSWDEREGKPVRKETFDADGTLLRTERFAYVTPGSAPFVARLGDALRGADVNAAALETRVALRERVISQQGRDFRWRVGEDCGGALCFDAFGRPVAIERSGTRTRIDRTTHADDLAQWVLGQVASTSTFDPERGATIETLRVDHDPKSAQPLRRFVRGLLQETRTYHADGTLASRSDGRDTPAFDTTVRYSGWMRGIPTNISFPGGARLRAGVEVDGTLRWVAGETGARTCFAYDAVGRRVRTTWPAESEPTRCGDDDWNETTTTFEQSTAATPLLAAGHWKRTERTGNGVRLTWYDALWRAVLAEEHDATDIPGTRRTTRSAFDAGGRETFRSTPSNLAVPPPEGIATQYDALGRMVRVEQASELGTLASTIEHLDGFRLRATNARGHATTIERLRAYDTPDAPWPEAIAYPEDLHVDIERDTFDQPTRITRRNADGTLATSIRLVHDAHGRLCKTIAPERGATVIGHDVVGNVLWTAAGTALDDPNDCQQAAAWQSGRRVDRTWDARNRLATVSFPDGVGNQARTYTPDGLLNRITTYNARADDILFNTYAWNARRLPVRDSLTYPGMDTWDLVTSYNRNGHATTLAYPNRTAIALVPNALGQPTRIGGYATNVRWHPDGSPAQFTYGNGIVHATTRNRRGLLERRRDSDGATVFLDESLDYDANGNVAATSDGLPGARGDRLHVHDALDRLVQVASPLFATAHYAHDVLDRLVLASIGGPHARTHHFCRDGSGHLTNVKTVDCASGPSVIGIDHDPAGNLVRMNAQAFAYDAGHRLRTVAGIASYAYDGHDRRVRTTSLRGEGDILSQYDRTGRLMWQSDYRDGLGKLYLYLGDRMIAVREQPLTGGVAANRYLHTDAEGTPVAETATDRTLLRRSEYEPFGLLLNSPARDGVGFRGRVSEAGTGLLYAPEGDAHPMLPGRLGACGWQHQGVVPEESLDATRVLRRPPRVSC